MFPCICFHGGKEKGQRGLLLTGEMKLYKLETEWSSETTRGDEYRGKVEGSGEIPAAGSLEGVL